MVFFWLQCFDVFDEEVTITAKGQMGHFLSARLGREAAAATPAAENEEEEEEEEEDVATSAIGATASLSIPIPSESTCSSKLLKNFPVTRV